MNKEQNYLNMCIKFSLWILLFTLSRNQEVFAEENNIQSRGSQCGDVDCFFGDTISCKEKCGCDRRIPYGFNNSTGQCDLNLKKLMISLAQKYKTQEKNRKRTERIFQGILISAVIVITWASVCTVSICCYCCRMTYTDHRLRTSVKEAARKLRTHPMAKKRIEKPEKIKTSEECLSVKREDFIV